MRRAAGCLEEGAVLPQPAGEAGSAEDPRDSAAALASPLPGRPLPIVDAVRIAAWLSISAGAIHAIATVDHFSHWWLYGAFFLALTYGQVLWGIALLRNPVSDRGLSYGAIANLVIVAVWLGTRTIGVPLGPEAGSTEPIGTMDVSATLVELVLVAYLAIIVSPRLRSVRGLRALIGAHRLRFGMMLASACFFAALLGGHQH